MGRLTKDPETKTTSASVVVTTYTLAVNRRFQKAGEERQADFIQVVTFSKLAEFCSNYFRKGQQVAVVGRIQTRSWQDAEGQRRYATDVVADEAYFADSKKDAAGGYPAAGPGPKPTGRLTEKDYGDDGFGAGMPDAFEEDDLPF